MNKQAVKIKARSVSDVNISSFIDFLLFRSSWFGHGNGLSGNKMILQSLVVSIIVTALYSYTLPYIDELPGFDNPPGSVSVFLGLFVGFFLNERLSYYQKWRYLAGLYNDVLKAPRFLKDQEPKHNHYYRDSLKGALVLDCLEMGMWAHSSFKLVVYNYLQKAISRKNLNHCLKEGITLETAKNIALEQQIFDLKMEKTAFNKSGNLDEAA